MCPFNSETLLLSDNVIYSMQANKFDSYVTKEYLRMQSAFSRSDYLIRISYMEFCFLQTIKF